MTMLQKAPYDAIRLRFFVKHFIQFLVPALLSVIIIGILSYVLSYSELRRSVEDNNIALLDNTIQSMDAIIKEIEMININLSSNPSIKVRLKRILSNDPLILTADDHTAFSTILDMLFVSSNSNKYIHSFYIYFESANDLFIVSKDKLISALDDSNDRAWHGSYLTHKNGISSSWAEKRVIRTNALDSGTPLLTLYTKTHSSLTGRREADGVLVLNVYADSINKLLESMTADPEQVLLVLDEQRQPIFTSNASVALNADWLPVIEEGQYAHAQAMEFVVTAKQSTTYNWTFVSLVPRETLYKLPNQMVFSTLLGFLLSIAASACFAVYSTRKAYNHFSSMLTIIELTQQGKSVAGMQPRASSNEYMYIIHNLLKTFIERDYMSVQKKYRMQTLELQAMQAQMNPHFLLNTMETIYWKAMDLTRQPNETTATIENISDILQYALYKPLQTVCLSEEIDMAKSYLSIQHVRHKNRFATEWIIDPGISEYRINKLILQCLLENSIYHGYRGERHLLRIRIRITRARGALRILIADNGRGITKQRLAEVRETLNKADTDFSKHIGLYNTHRRVVLMYGEPYGLKVSSIHGVGTAVRIEVPPLTE